MPSEPRPQPAYLTPEPIDDLTPAPAEPAVRWGDDSDAPTPDIQLKSKLPANASADWDPVTAGMEGYDGRLSARICNVIGVRFVPAGRIYMYDAGDGFYAKGDRVVVEGDRGQRNAVVASASCRRPPPRSLKRILRRGTAADAEDDQSRAEEIRSHLSTAKALAKELKLPIKVFRAHLEDDNKKIAVYYSCDDKTDVRPLSRKLSDALPLRVDLRHTGVRDEAKLVGGIGACGQELCCTTWLPSFVPVSIKHAKDQGLALNPQKISGQCGRLKCCLVYEQENYAKLRKGLPKLGKRVITKDGLEGRVIELDVLHQRIRVSVGRGESKVYMKGEVEPMFASQPQGSGKKKSGEKRQKQPKNDPQNTETENEKKGEEPTHDDN
jgi:cell fate regulator YaaT (PSP1 superfamily)